MPFDPQNLQKSQQIHTSPGTFSQQIPFEIPQSACFAESVPSSTGPDYAQNKRIQPSLQNYGVDDDYLNNFEARQHEEDQFQQDPGASLQDGKDGNKNILENRNDFDNPLSEKEEARDLVSEWELSQSVAVDLTLLQVGYVHA